MIRHLVLWKLRTDDPGERAEIVDGMRARFGELVGVIPGLVSLEILADPGSTAGNWDAGLHSLHDDQAALDGYQAHPAHREVAAWVREQVADRVCVDSEVPAALA